MAKNLFDAAQLGNLTLQNRAVMAPMTRSRATAAHVPTSLMARYYGQRASAGLLITEGVSPSPDGLGYARIPGLFNAEHVAAWKPVTEAAHQGGAKIFVQFMHTGRVSHPLNQPEGAWVLAPSAVAAPGEMWTDQKGMQPHPVPHEMTEEEIRKVIGEFAEGAKLAVQAGFDGVELHGANGYLIDQFLNTASNQRKDRWGGSLENRMRFALEVARAVVGAIGAERVGIRLSPYGVFNGMAPDPEMDELYAKLVWELDRIGLVYVHIVDHSSMGAPAVSAALKGRIRTTFKGAYILSGGYDLEHANVDLAAGKGDLVAFGRPFIANPDLVSRLRSGRALAAPDPATFYTPGEKGYTDYA